MLKKNNPGCTNSSCQCGGDGGSCISQCQCSDQCFKELAVKFSGFVGGSLSAFCTGACGVTQNTWIFYDCATASRAAGVPIGISSGESGLWSALVGLGTGSSFDLCVFGVVTSAGWIKITITPTLVTVTVQYEYTNHTGVSSWIRWAWDFATTDSQCPDFTDPTEFSPTSTTTGGTQTGCDFSEATALLSWV